jgi:hypothetical protein
MASSFDNSKLSQTHIMLALFSLVAIVAYVNPSIVHHLNSTILGRLVTVIIIIYFASKNLVAGLLATLIVIAIMQTTIYQEGMEGETADEPTDAQKKPKRGKARRRKIANKIKDKYDLTCAVGSTLVKGKCMPDGSLENCTKGRYQYCKENEQSSTVAAPVAEEAEQAEQAENFQTLGFSVYNTGDQLSNDLSRKAKRSNELVNVSTKSGSDDSVQPSEDIKESFTQLRYSHFN